MGLLRFILAISVVIGHLSPFGNYKLLDGQTAVQSFFVISGFYMALILNTKYPSNWMGFFAFFGNRVLRLFPIYYICLVLSIIVCVYAALALNRHPIANFINFPLSSGSLAAVLTTQASIIGMDALLLFHRDAGGTVGLNHGSMLQQPSPFLFDYFFVPQAWSLGLELVFYAIAPFIVRSWRICAMVIGVSLAARFVIYQFGISYPPFDYRFFPFEIAIFLLGALAFHIYQRFGSRLASFTLFKIGVPVLIFSYPFVFNFLPYTTIAGFHPKQWFYVALVIFGLPILFKISRNNGLDRQIGDLSYPIYISHLMVASLLCFALGMTGSALGLVSLMPILAFSAALLIPQGAVERLRERRIDKLRTANSTEQIESIARSEMAPAAAQ